MGYTDQSGIRQHLTLALCCCVGCVVPIRVINIDNNHLCDLAVLLNKGNKKQGGLRNKLVLSRFSLTSGKIMSTSVSE